MRPHTQTDRSAEGNQSDGRFPVVRGGLSREKDLAGTRHLPRCCYLFGRPETKEEEEKPCALARGRVALTQLLCCCCCGCLVGKCAPNDFEAPQNHNSKNGEEGRASSGGGGLGRAPRITEQPGDVVVRKHEPVTLRCRADGEPVPRIAWFHDGRPVRDSATRMVLPDGQLFFLQVQHSRRDQDTGLYWCTATNALGTARSRNASVELAGEWKKPCGRGEVERTAAGQLAGTEERRPRLHTGVPPQPWPPAAVSQRLRIGRLASFSSFTGCASHDEPRKRKKQKKGALRAVVAVVVEDPGRRAQLITSNWCTQKTPAHSCVVIPEEPRTPPVRGGIGATKRRLERPCSRSLCFPAT
ncbi:hypothetical protein HPB48_004753 [Haemaphysalis longicornis]|uniref:Ig-like domain-containing protein n=1 Tax=Haemaphysalis longicornis TaxID=44386 RepID=A0A9J6FR71_HAELO|nr:hypothetical protein HPB48_004753 [Haemaphysalis longicornis]